MTDLDWQEVIVIVLGLIGGYWVVSKMFTGRGDSRQAPVPPVEPPPDISRAPPWYEILQVHPQATPFAIRDAYKRLVSQYHPDKVENLGQDIKDLAVHKMQAITAAYREGMRARGEQA